MILVVPPANPAAVPVKKSSAVTVPMKGSCMCVCGSIPPGITYCPLASRCSAPAGACAAAASPTATILPSTHNTSARSSRSAFTTVPPRIRRGRLAVLILVLLALSSVAERTRRPPRGQALRNCVCAELTWPAMPMRYTTAAMNRPINQA
ncbi:hypothetical protein SDC9_137775 [bioreactor metagenome]|uniref:Uncharacterized protein n=1 Tax=bioreactor metagenome TaxID=1076179 RepID=A0A645DPE6_9ZZZZ